MGTFDEAFKSRIQLALHYPNLDQGQRLKIWTDFIARLEVLGEKMDITTIRPMLTKLAGHAMNGRQIRNVLTTARQLARSKDRAMNFVDIDHVVNVSRRFDDYVKELNEGNDDDQIAKEIGIR